MSQEQPYNKRELDHFFNDIREKFLSKISLIQEDTTLIKEHLKTLNGSVARHEKEILSLNKDNENLFEKIGEVIIYKGELEKKEKRSLKTYRDWFWGLVKFIGLIFIVLFFNLLVKTEIIGNIDRLPF